MNRRRRRFVGADGRLFIVAADFAGRGILGAGGDQLALARRSDLLKRIVRALEVPTVDGVLGTADVIDDLFYVEGARLELGLPSLLDGRILVGSVNRGGTLGACFELDDTNTGYSIGGALRRRLDATKVMIRLASEDAGSGLTLTRAAEIVRTSGEHALPIVVEIFPVHRDLTHWATIKDATELARMAVIASALGDDSAYTWLKLPYCNEFAIVAGATSCPIAVLGGDSTDTSDVSEIVAAALEAGDNVRGAVVGRRSLFPGDGDVGAACARIGGVIHKSASASLPS